VVKAGVCKTPIHRFESGRRLQFLAGGWRPASNLGLTCNQLFLQKLFRYYYLLLKLAYLGDYVGELSVLG
jgi:hypothetical protein